jgi:hypothetical protein
MVFGELHAVELLHGVGGDEVVLVTPGEESVGGGLGSRAGGGGFASERGEVEAEASGVEGLEAFGGELDEAAEVGAVVDGGVTGAAGVLEVGEEVVEEAFEGGSEGEGRG